MRYGLHIPLFLLTISAVALWTYGNPQPHCAQAASSRWSEPTRLLDIGVHDEMAAASDLYGQAHAIWSSGQGTADSPSTLFYALWDGSNWSPAVDVIAQTNGNIAWPSLASAPDGSLLAIWQGTNSLIYFSTVPAGRGLDPHAWSYPQALSLGPAFHSDIQVDSTGQVHVLYAAAGGDVFYISSEDGGARWHPPINVSNNPPGVATDYPRLAIDGRGRFHAVWTGYTLPNGVPIVGTYYARSEDSGLTWSDAVEVTSGEDYAEINVLAVGEDQIHLAWNGSITHGGRYHRYSIDGGKNWSWVAEVIPKSTPGGGKTGPPALAVDSAGTVYLASGLNPGNVMVVTWNQGQWAGPTEIPSPDGWAEKVRLVVAGGNRVHALWQAWTSALQTNAPSVVLPTPQVTPSIPSPEPEPTLAPTAAVELLTPAPASLDPRPRDAAVAVLPGGSLLVSIAPAALLVLVVVIVRVRRGRHRGE